MMLSRSAGVAVPPVSSVRSPSMSSAGQSDRLAMVRFLILAPRKLSRSRMTGGEFRFGTDSTGGDHHGNGDATEAAAPVPPTAPIPSPAC
jgi:hypothetical protein